MDRRSYKRPGPQTSAALQRIKTLITQADDIFPKHPELSHRYAFLARKIAMKHKTRLPATLKRRICKGCDGFLKAGHTARIRTQRGHVVITCLRCKKITRVGYRADTKSKQKT